jgi:hypothetical protein
VVIEIFEDVSKSKIKWLPCQVSNDLRSRSAFWSLSLNVCLPSLD